MRLLGLAACLILLGCGSEPEPPRGGVMLPAAYAVEDVDGLFDQPDWYTALSGEDVVAETRWKPLALVSLMEWLRGKGIDLDAPRDGDDLEQRFSAEWELYTVVLTTEHRRRYGERLARLGSADEELYERATEAPELGPGEALTEWLAALQQAINVPDGARVVIIPIDE